MIMTLGVFQSKQHYAQWKQLTGMNGTAAYLAPIKILLPDAIPTVKAANALLTQQGKKTLKGQDIIERYGTLTTPKDMMDTIDWPESLSVRVSWDGDRSVYSVVRSEIEIFRQRYPSMTPYCFLCQHSDGYAVMLNKNNVTQKGGVLTACPHREWNA